MNKTFVKKMKENLLVQKQFLKEKSNQTVDIDVDGDEIDEVQGALILDLATQLSTRDLAKLKLVDNALQRIEDETYGICQDCENKIPEARLLANPHFLTCVSCAEDREREEKNRLTVKRY
jgi:DnaK suppressor protein